MKCKVFREILLFALGFCLGSVFTVRGPVYVDEQPSPRDWGEILYYDYDRKVWTNDIEDTHLDVYDELTNIVYTEEGWYTVSAERGRGRSVPAKCHRQLTRIRVDNQPDGAVRNDQLPARNGGCRARRAF